MRLPSAYDGSVMARSIVLAGSLALLAVACGGGAADTPFVWVTEAPPQGAESAELIIKEGDTINVRVFGQDNLSSQQKVRTDGKIATPAVGEIVAKGKKPAQLAKEIEERLKSVLQVPSVSIAVEQQQQINVSVVGEVKNGGTFQLDQGATVLHALASAGGLTEFAGDDKIYVVRKGSNQRIRFKYIDLRGGEAKSMGFQLHAGDVVVVE